MSLSTFKLPACERCRLRKSKCDTKGPKCAACQKGNAACIIVDPLTHERHSRSAIHELEKKIELLETRLSQQSQSSPSTVSPTSTAHRPREKTHFVGDGSGLGLFERVSSSTYAANARLEVSQRLNQRSSISRAELPAHNLPSLDVAYTFVDRYLTHSHLHHPFVPRNAINGALRRIYEPAEAPASKEDLYRIFMILAISSVTKYRRGEISEHPYGYFRAAQKMVPQVQLIGSIDGILNLLLIARFAMYYHIDSSIWDITQLCMRQCIELGLHRPPLTPLPPLIEQSHRNIFWDCYVHDRYSSGILGRPYAIAEQDIEVALPVEISEEHLKQLDVESLKDVIVGNDMVPNETSVSLFVIGLRRITARIQTRFYSAHGPASHRSRSLFEVGQVLTDLNDYLQEYQNWLATAPLFSEAQSLYQRHEWYEFLVEKDRLFLIRGALSQLPVSSLHPPQDLLVMCLKCATSVIELYTAMFSRGHITWTRSYFQILFTSGLSIMYTLPILRTASEDVELKAILESAKRALISCSNVLTLFVSEMPDAGRFAAVFEALSKQYLRSPSESNSKAPSPPRQQTDTHELDLQSQGLQEQLQPPIVHNSSSNLTNHNLTHDNNQYANHMSLRIPENLDSASSQVAQDFPIQLDFEDFQHWSAFPTNTESFLGQMEMGLGEYAWGGQPDVSMWDQYFAT